jgi:hypothetical protein
MGRAIGMVCRPSERLRWHPDGAAWRVIPANWCEGASAGDRSRGGGYGGSGRRGIKSVAVVKVEARGAASLQRRSWRGLEEVGLRALCALGDVAIGLVRNAQPRSQAAQLWCMVCRSCMRTANIRRHADRSAVKFSQIHWRLRRCGERLPHWLELSNSYTVSASIW